MLLGDGVGELEGLYFQDGILAQAYSTSASASIRRAMAKVESAGYENTAIVLNPVDYAELELELNTAGDYRNHSAPADAGPRTVWGVPVASVPSAPLGLAMLGDLSQAHLWIRENLQVTITETNEDDFKRNLFVARAEMRAAFGVGTPGALAMVKLNGTVAFPAA
jgi:HK97 family phage major capsid protein